jgi:hypothetical protein
LVSDEEDESLNRQLMQGEDELIIARDVQPREQRQGRQGGKGGEAAGGSSGGGCSRGRVRRERM